MLGFEWRFTADNRLYHVVLSAFVLAAAALAPLWDFPALLKVILLMGINVVVIPLAFVVVLFQMLVGEVETLPDGLFFQPGS